MRGRHRRLRDPYARAAALGRSAGRAGAAFALTATINWDLLAVALTAAAMLMWSRGRSLAFGVLLGLATAAKLYSRAAARAAAGAVLARGTVAGVRHGPRRCGPSPGSS
ncbi:hypothetical protein GCM10023238_19340 [Streptomyces heliomycini]